MRRFAALAVALSLATPIAAAHAAEAARVAVPAGPDPSAAYARIFSGRACPQDALCLYRDFGSIGGGSAISAGDSLVDLGTVAYDVNDVMSSWSNDTGRTCTWWEHMGQGGGAHPMPDGYRVNVTRAESDSASSVRC
ncbi:peptidase inhibitor family I36 protein [Streptomyces clavuligerus]|uniref:Peptidase inhibitor family I36 n=1 Tax=Streptomyces clavuligerus TaxID=1901 RepID=E2Q3P5_STRCL|nr:peptidase inhibitor family I36 protein [Streptomyces clavuligerus]ANW20214.1 hypothetical protein BB341_19340 [Streptomyces clavuligerus]AXU14838.1 hypothetical protein D1794_20160 [Streptomyces clavuligerus]EFG06865.1 Hypothetical protein SCLAV_1791 [Streptomyces clavuligerus]MBY6304875.1 peptidase inhibitor family I36 protein [Streptomyces clavuligerus]QCS07610.1 hypothetical protein CRV15_19515 [Streptomyces clavuligerus]